MSNSSGNLFCDDALSRVLGATPGTWLPERAPRVCGRRLTEVLMHAREADRIQLAHDATGLPGDKLAGRRVMHLAAMVQLQPFDVEFSDDVSSVTLRCRPLHPRLPGRLVTLNTIGIQLHAEVGDSGAVHDAAALRAVEAFRNRREATVINPIVAHLLELAASGDREGVPEVLTHWRQLSRLVLDGNAESLRTAAAGLCTRRDDRGVLKTLPDADPLRVCLGAGLQHLAYDRGVLSGRLEDDPGVVVTVGGDQVSAKRD